MNTRLLLHFTLSIFSGASLLAQNPVVEHSSFSEADSLLLARKYSAARDRITMINASGAPGGVESDPALVQEYMTLIDRLEAVTALPDSITSRYALAVSGMGERFDAVNAGTPAHAMFEAYTTELQSSRISSAYERYTLAEFFLGRHVWKERQRLLSNHSRTRQLVKLRDFDGADLLVKGFRAERIPHALVKLGDTLSGRYDDLAEAIRAGRAADLYDASRITVSKHVYVGAGFGYNPGISIKYKDLRFFDQYTLRAVVMKRTDDAFKFPLMGLWIEAGYYLSPSVEIGVTYNRASTKQSNSEILSIQQQGISYEAEFRYQAMSASLKYLIDNRTGFRPYAAASVGYLTCAYVPQKFESEYVTIVPIGFEEADVQGGAELGMEFVPSVELPACFSVFARLLFNGTQLGTLAGGSTQILLGAKAGYLF